MSSCCSWRRDPSEMRGVTQLNASWLKDEGLLSAASSCAPASKKGLSLYCYNYSLMPHKADFCVGRVSVTAVVCATRH